MQPDMEQLLSTIQSLITSEMGWQLSFPGHEDGGELEPFIWNAGEQGELTPLNLVRSEGWLQAMAPTAVLDSWLALERAGSVNGETWLVPDRDAAELLLDSATYAEREQLYQTLLEQLQTQLQDLQGWQLSYDADYALMLLTGEAEKQWIGLAPSVPHATQIDDHAPIQMAVLSPSEPQPISEAANSLESPIQATLDRLGPIQLYGYYGGGYNQIHNHRLQLVTGLTLDQVIEQVMLKTGLLQIGSLTALQPTVHDSPAPCFEQLTQFLHALSKQRVYRFSFWNSEHFYMFGQPTIDSSGTLPLQPSSEHNPSKPSPKTATWAGVVLRSRFTYNP